LFSCEKEELNLAGRILGNNFSEFAAGTSIDFFSKSLAFFSAGLSYFNKLINIGDFMFLIGLFDDCLGYAGSILESAAWFIEAAPVFNYYEDFIHRKENHSKKTSTTGTAHTVEFINISFKYPNSDSFILRNINFSLSLPEKISIAGRNGAGKTTIIKLLMRLYKPTQGLIKLDGRDIYDYDYADYLSLFSTVMQDFKLFAFKISENISSFDSAINYSLLDYCVQQSDVGSFLGKYPAGCETYISNAYEAGGLEFSGGEQQKIALARAIYKNTASFYILDEPSASYDAEAESRLYSKYRELLGGKASIFISHRLTSCKLSDRILLFENGEIIEDGSYRELMLKNGSYKHLYELQAKLYREDQ
jgi:ATP-binding cassette subfamily B protein/ATP-binding cassette subfamily C protein